MPNDITVPRMQEIIEQLERDMVDPLSSSIGLDQAGVSVEDFFDDLKELVPGPTRRTYKRVRRYIEGLTIPHIYKVLTCVVPETERAAAWGLLVAVLRQLPAEERAELFAQADQRRE